MRATLSLSIFVFEPVTRVLDAERDEVRRYESVLNRAEGLRVKDEKAITCNFQLMAFKRGDPDFGCACGGHALELLRSVTGELCSVLPPVCVQATAFKSIQGKTI